MSVVPPLRSSLARWRSSPAVAPATSHSVPDTSVRLGTGQDSTAHHEHENEPVDKDTAAGAADTETAAG